MSFLYLLRRDSAARQCVWGVSQLGQGRHSTADADERKMGSTGHQRCYEHDGCIAGPAPRGIAAAFTALHVGIKENGSTRGMAWQFV